MSKEKKRKTSIKLKIIIPVAALVVIIAVFAILYFFTGVFQTRNNDGSGNPDNTGAPGQVIESTPQSPTPPAGYTDSESSLPGAGGQIRITGHTEVKFTPGESGVWDIRTSDNGNSDPLILLIDQHGEIMYYNDNGEADMHDHYWDGDGDLNAQIVAYLDAGITYTIEVKVYTDDDSTGSCTLTVSFVPEEVIEYMPIGLGDTAVPVDSYFSFTPDSTGTYEFRTSETDGSDPYILILNEDLTNIIYDDNSGGGYSAYASVYLEAGVKYHIEVVFYIHGGEGSTLTISRAS